MVLAHCHCLLSCSISVTLKPTCILFTSFSSSPCSRSYYLPDSLTPGPYRCFLCLAILLVLFHVQAGDMHAVRFFPEPFTPRASSSHVLCWACATNNHVFRRACPLCSIWSDRQTDTRTHSQTNFRWTNNCRACSRSPPIIEQLQQNSWHTCNMHVIMAYVQLLAWDRCKTFHGLTMWYMYIPDFTLLNFGYSGNDKGKCYDLAVNVVSGAY